MREAFRPGSTRLCGHDWIVDCAPAADIATAFGLEVLRLDAASPGVPAKAHLRPIRHSMPRSITLALMSRPEDERWRTLARRYAPLFRDVVVMLDAEGAPGGPHGVRVLAHPLDGDFGAQRNRLQEAIDSRWVLHLDTDETLTSKAVTTLEAVARHADRRGVRAVALPRINLVDGRASDLFPDVQYRLVRADERFENAVHERVRACRLERLTMVARHGAILHHIDREHVLARTRLYDRLGQDADRRADEQALLRAFRGREPAGWDVIPPE